jgi:serine/threonine protein kinase
VFVAARLDTITAMKIDPAIEARVFARLSLRGVVSKEDVARLFLETKQAAAEGRPASLARLALAERLIEKRELIHALGTEGEDAPPLPGYAFVGKLGEGGTSNVFRVKAADGSTQAVKILHREIAAQPAEVKAFLAEAALLRSLDHPNVVKGHKAGRFEGRYLFFMEDVLGRTLQEAILADGALDEDTALFAILQVSRALEYIRGKGVVHRDIKPGNIMLTPDNEVKLIDLGFATQAGADDGQAEGTTRGTAAFLSPEQARGQADLDVRSDIYSLGATLYQLVLGTLPFEGQDDEELVQQTVLAGLSAEATKGGRISAHMHYFIEKMMAKDRDVRYQDPNELMADIEDQISGKKTLDLQDAPADDEDEAARARKRADRLRRKRRRKR